MVYQAPPFSRPKYRPWRFRTAGNRFEDGVKYYDLEGWDEFTAFVQREMLNFGNYVWRGQSHDDWLLEPSLDRRLRESGRHTNPIEREKHRARFAMAVRGRRGPNPPPPEEDDLWALGRHHGLATPLLDWTQSPFVAAFFAFEQADEMGTERRAVFGLNEPAIKARSNDIEKFEGASSPHVLRFIRPQTHDNPRLISQQGLFTKGPDGVDVERWVKTYFQGVKRAARLFKLTLPSRDRKEALKALNRMNINHQSLYPDVEGAALYCNICLTIRHYESPDDWYGEPDPPPPLSDIAPPEPIQARPIGFELDSDALLAFFRGGSKRLQRLDKRLYEARGQDCLHPLQLMSDQPEPLDYVVESLRSAGLVRTGDLDRLLEELDEDQLLAFILKFFNASSYTEGDSTNQLGVIALARNTTETGFLNNIAARFAGKGYGPSESWLREYYAEARQIAPPVG